MLTAVILFFKSLKIRDFILIGCTLGAFATGMGIGIQGGKLLERNDSKSELHQVKEDFNKYKVEQVAVVAALTRNANLWKSTLEDAQRRAIESAQEQSRQIDAVISLSDKLKQPNTNTIIREYKNDCKATDIIVNTDSADRLRNCFSSSSPSTCSGNN